MQRRIGIAQALINDPAFLILDEPTTGLDPIGTKQVKDLIVTLGERGKTILLSSHLLTDVEDVVDRMVILYGGKIRQAGTCDELLTSRTSSILETEALDDETIAELQAVLARRSKHIAKVSAPRQKLEELFVQIVEQAKRDRLATSGAEHGGSTASFLREGLSTQSKQGEDLIAGLVAESEQQAMPVEARPDAAPDKPRQAPDESQAAEQLIDDLLSADEGADETAPTPDTAAPPAAPDRPARTNTTEPATTEPATTDPTTKGPDDSLIDSLLSDADDTDPDQPDTNRGGRR